MSVPAVLIAAVIGSVALTGCGKDASDSDAEQPTSDQAATTLTPLQEVRGEFDAASDGLEAATLDTSGLPTKPPAGFSVKEVRALADRAIDVAERATDPELSDLTVPNAVNYVLMNQYPGTVLDFKSTKGLNLGVGKDSSAWVIANRMAGPPARPARYLRVEWKVEAIDGTLANGTPARYLSVALEVFSRHDLPAAEGTAPVFIRRVVTFSSYKPLGGPEWWPSLYVRTSMFGLDECRQINDALLAPAADLETLKTSVKELKKKLRGDPFEMGEDIDMRKAAKEIAKTCR